MLVICINLFVQVCIVCFLHTTCVYNFTREGTLKVPSLIMLVSYPNCNSVHEIDLVRSSGAGSYVLPARDAARDATRERRKLGAYPPVLRAQQHRLQRKWPDEKRKKRAKLNARGIAQEAELEFLGQGWFRAAWEMSVEGIPEYDEEEETFRFDESVVLKTLRCVHLSTGR